MLVAAGFGFYVVRSVFSVMHHSITEITFTFLGGSVSVYLFSKPQNILEALPAGLVAMGLMRKLHPTATPTRHSPLIPPHPFKYSEIA